MKHSLVAGVLLSLFVQTASAQELGDGTSSPTNARGSVPPPRMGGAPPSGVGFIVAGWIATGVGALNAASLPLCFYDEVIDPDLKKFCVGSSAGLAVVGLGLGIPFLVVGYNQKKKRATWESATLHLSRTSFVPLEGGGMATYGLNF